MNFPPLLGGSLEGRTQQKTQFCIIWETSIFHPETGFPGFLFFFILMSEFANIVRADGPFFFERPVTRKI